jgi:hypothetical protein
MKKPMMQAEEYLNMLIQKAGFISTYIYSSLDQTTRVVFAKRQLSNFSAISWREQFNFQ